MDRLTAERMLWGTTQTEAEPTPAAADVGEYVLCKMPDGYLYRLTGSELRHLAAPFTVVHRTNDPATADRMVRKHNNERKHRR